MAILSRRDFIRAAGLSTAGILGFRGAGCEVHGVDPLSTGRLLPFVTPLNEFYFKNGAEAYINGWSLPNIDPEDWTLTIDGEVDTPLTLTIDDFEGRETVEVLKTMRCVIDSNTTQGLVSTGVFRGVPLRVFLEEAGADRNAARIRTYGADGFRGNIRMSKVFNRTGEGDQVEPLLVTHLNGEPLPRRHGRPCRLLVHDAFGFVNMKWIERLEVTSDDSAFGTYQQEGGFTDDGQLRIYSRITGPSAGLDLPSGPIQIVGYGLSGAGRVERMEVRIDDGPFEPMPIVPIARLIEEFPEIENIEQLQNPSQYPYPFRSVWSLFEFEWDAPPGDHTIEVRAFDTAGNEQPFEDTDIVDGINSTPAISVRVK